MYSTNSECECQIILEVGNNRIEYCPKHKAADDMKEALEETERYISIYAHVDNVAKLLLHTVRVALAKSLK